MIIIKKTSEKDDVYSQMFQFYIGAIIISTIFYFFIGDGQYNTIENPAAQFIFREWFSNLEFTLMYMIVLGFTAAGAFLFVFSAYLHLFFELSIVSLYNKFERIVGVLYVDNSCS